MYTRRTTRTYGRRRAYGRRRKTYRRTRRTYRKARRGRVRVMSRRRLLNATSQKKRDNMMTYSASNNTDTPTPGSITFSGQGAMLYCPTARPFVALKSDASRNSTTAYIKGLRENMIMQTISLQGTGNPGLPWFHRRIIFTAKGPLWPGQNQSTSLNAYDPAFGDPFNDPGSGGMTRLQRSLQGVAYAYLRDILFEGTEGTDWSSQITAKVDTKHFNILYDRQERLSSGNESSIFKVNRYYHPIGKNLVYNDEERAGDEIRANYSVNSKLGIGNVYVYDFFLCPSEPGSAEQGLQVQTEATLYWHEK